MESHHQKKRPSGVKITELPSDGSDDENPMARGQQPPVNPEDIHLTNIGSDMPVAIRESEASDVPTDFLNDILSLPQDSRPNVTLANQVYAVENSPGATVADTIIQNTTTVVEEKSPLSRLIDSTNRQLEKFSLDEYYETQATKAASECFRQGVAFIEGPGKSGKTTMALYLMKKDLQNFTPILVTKAHDLQALALIRERAEHKHGKKEKETKQKDFIVCIDNVFTGKNEMRQHLLDVLEMVVETSVQLIVTSSRMGKLQSVYARVWKERYMIKIPKYPLQDHERYEILKCKSKRSRLLKQKVKGKEEDVLQDIAKSTNYPWFLGILDELDYLNPRPIVNFFRHPTRYLVKQIEEIRDDETDKFIALVIIMKQGFLEERSLKSPESPKPHEAMETYTSLIQILGTPLVTPTKIRDAAREMVGEYVSFTNKRFEFINDSLMDAVCRVWFDVSPDHAISWCPLKFIVHNTEIIQGPNTDNILLEDAEQIELLKKRFFREEDIMAILRHQAFSDRNFVKSIIKDLNIHFGQYKDILLQSVTLRQLGLVQEITQNILRTLPEGGESIKYLALEKACEAGNVEAYEELVKAGAEPTLACMKVCQLGKNQQIMSQLLDKFNSKFFQLSRDVLRQWIPIIAEVGNIAMIKRLFDRLQGFNDESMVILLQKIIMMKDYDKYLFTINECQEESLDWKMLLLAASEGGQVDILKDILKRIHKLDIQICLQEPFEAACKFNNKGIAEILYATDPGLLELTVSQGQTPLHIAAGIDHNDDPVTLKWLLLKKKDWKTHAVDTNGSTALHSACHTGNITAVEALLDAKFDPLAVDGDGNTALHVHIDGKFVNKHVVVKLLENGEAVASVQNKDGNTPLHLMCIKPSPVHVSILQTLIDNNKDVVNNKNGKGQTPLHVLIASSGRPLVVDILLQNRSFDFQQKDDEAQTVLHLACSAGSDEIIKKLVVKLKHDQQILNVGNAKGQTPLHCYASTRGNEDTMKLLLNDKNINSKDGADQTALHIAVKVPDNLEMCKALITSGADTNAQDNRKYTPLHILCDLSENGPDLVLLLLQNGSSIDAKDRDHRTPLHRTCLSSGHKSPELVEILLSKGADIWERDGNGNTAVHSCCSTCGYQSAKVLQILLRHLKAEGQKKNMDWVKQALSSGEENGDTPLHRVCISRGQHKKEVAKILIDEGADVSLTNNGRDTVIDLSRRNDITEITQLVIETTMVSSCFDRQKLQNAKNLLSCDVDNEEQLSMMLQTVVKTDGPSTIGVLEMLISRGADVKCKTEEGYTVIHLAAMTQGQFTNDIIEYLILKGVDVSEKDIEGETALHKVSTGETEFSSSLIKSLVSLGLSVKEKDNMGNTPLHKLFGKLNKYYSESMEELVSLSSDVDSPNGLQKTPCDLAKSQGKGVIGELFETYCTKQKVLNLKPLEHMLSRAANINNKDKDGNTVLHKICMKRVSFVCNNVRLLLKLGADKTIYNNMGETAFDLACETGLDEDVRELTVIQMPDDLDNDGPSTPLYSPLSPPPLPCPEWFRRSSSTESWEEDLRRGMSGIRNAAGMRHFDDQMEEFEQQAKHRQRNFFKHHM